MASSDAPKSLNMSREATCSGLRKSETIQKRIIAPKIRRSLNTSGVTSPPAMTIFAIGDISPHETLASSIEP